MAFQIESSGFKEGAKIPSQYSCEGADFSVPLKWSGAPSNIKSFAIIMDDPDAPMGTWVHWVVYNIPPHVTALTENQAKEEKLNIGALQGMTDFKKVGYGGPCPPPGKPHRYFIKLYALDILLNLPSKATKQQLLGAMQKHILAQTQLMGTYQRGANS